MIVEGYEIHVYCDGSHSRMSVSRRENQAETFGKNRTLCRMDLKNRGWLFDGVQCFCRWHALKANRNQLKV